MKIQHTIIGYYRNLKTDAVFVVLELSDNFEPHKAGWMRRPELDEGSFITWELPDGARCSGFCRFCLICACTIVPCIILNGYANFATANVQKYRMQRIF